VEHDRHAAPRGTQRDHPARLRRAHHGAHVVLGEHPLHGDHVGTVPIAELLERVGEPEQPGGHVELGRGAHHLDRDTAHRPPRAAVDHAEPAAGQPRVNAEHPHATPPAAPAAEHQFEPRLPAADNRVGTDAPGPVRAGPRGSPAARRVPGKRRRSWRRGPHGVGVLTDR